LAVFALLAISTPVWLGSQRGIVVGVFAAGVYGALYFLAGWRHDQIVAWSARHQYLDLLWVPPLAFLAFAGLTSWPIGWCAAAGVAAGAVMVPLKYALLRSRSSK
jgi:hypothetical protein